MPVGRRGGKSRVFAGAAVYLACCFDWSPHLAPGERGYVPVLAAYRDQAQAIMGYVKAFLMHPRLLPLVLPKRGRALSSDPVSGLEYAAEVNLCKSVTIEVATASYRAVRSRTVLSALCDEIAFWRTDDSSVNPDHEILGALRPAMATIPGHRLLVGSSPYARKGSLWEAYRDRYARPGRELVWKAPTRVMNPTVPQEFLDEEYERDAVSAEAEYGAEFRSDVDAFLPREVVEAAVERGVYERSYIIDHRIRYFAFTDPSGGSGEDSMTLAVAHCDFHDSKRVVLDALREVRPPFSPDSVVAEFAEVLRSYRIDTVEGDHYAGEWPRERFLKRGIRYQPADKAKSAIYLEWLPLMNAGRASLLDEPRLINQASALERRTSRVGKDTIDHPPRGHDDVVNVAAGAMVRASKANATSFEISDELLRRAAMGRAA